MDKLITINDLSSCISVPAKTIRNKLNDGTWPLPPVRIGRSLRWRESDVARIVSGEIVVPQSVREPSA